MNASGPAPKAASREFFLERRLTQIPKEGILAVSVPGLVDCWGKISEKYGTMKLQELLKPAIELAREGFPVHPKLSQAIKESSFKLSRDKSSREIFFKGNLPLQSGEMLVQKELAQTFEKIAAEGTSSFYKGDIARLVGENSARLGGLLKEEDLADYQAVWRKPISTTYREYTVYENPPVSQGHILLEELNLVEYSNLAELGHNTADSIHVMVESKKLAFADRIQYLGDPDFVNVPLEKLLSKEYARKRRAQIDMTQAAEYISKEQFDDNGGETTYFAIGDKHGNTVSFIQSLFHQFGSGVTVEAAGMLLNDRMTGFSLEKDHPNRLEPGKKTAHTLNTYIIMKGEDLFMLGGTPGADDQVQVNLQVIVNILDYEMNVQEAIEAPRWSSKPGTVPAEEKALYELWVEDRIPIDIRDQLTKRGHNVKVTGSWSFGGSQAIVIDHNNMVLMGGADPRRDGYAIGW
jgi:gamma-glutamyltranspeptidase/glutathione hydrolase